MIGRARHLVALGLSLVALGYPAACQAGTSGPGRVQWIIGERSGAFLFTQLGARSNAPSCATASLRWAVSMTQPGAQAIVSIVTTAYALGKPVTVVGTGSCEDWADTETVTYVQIAD